MSTPMQTKYIQLFKDTLEEYISRINSVHSFDDEDMHDYMEIYNNIIAEFAENAKKIKEVKTRGKGKAKGNTEGKTEKKTKDPNAPKGTRNAYIFFCMEARSEMKEDNPDMPSKELTKELAKLYQEEKKAGTDRYNKCLAKASKDKDRFSTEKEAYDSSTPSSPTASKPSSAKKSKSSDSDGPKKPRNSYIIYLSKIRDTVTDVTGKAKVTHMAKMYKEAKADNTELFQQCVKEYEEEKQRYLQAQGSDEDKALVQIAPTKDVVSESGSEPSSESESESESEAESESESESESEAEEQPVKSKGKTKAKAKVKTPPTKRKSKKAMAVA